MYVLGCIPSGPKGISVGLLLEEAGTREGVDVDLLGGVICSAV